MPIQKWFDLPAEPFFSFAKIRPDRFSLKLSNGFWFEIVKVEQMSYRSDLEAGQRNQGCNQCGSSGTLLVAGIRCNRLADR